MMDERTILCTLCVGLAFATRVAGETTASDVALIKPLVTNSVGVLREAAPIDLPKLEQLIRANWEFSRIPGISIVVIKDAKITYSGAFGTKNAVTAEPVTESTLFEACSLSKPVFAFAVNRLVDRGVIDLDQPLLEYFPECSAVSDVRSDERLALITARHVLAHRTGFPNWRTDQLSIRFTPGSEFGYSGEGYEYLKEVVAHIAGKPSAQLLREEAFEPLHMNTSDCICNDAIAKRSATGHDEQKPLEKWMPTEPFMAASLHVTAKDYAQFLVALLNRTGMSAKQWDEMLRPQFVASDSSDGRQYALGIGVEKTPYGTKYSHSGRNSGGFTCYFAVYDEPKFGYVVFANNQHASVFNEAFESYLVTGKPDKRANSDQ